MATLDLFGLGKDKDPEPDSGAQDAVVERSQPLSRKTWSRLLLLNLLCLTAFAAGFSVRFKGLVPTEVPLPPARPGGIRSPTSKQAQPPSKEAPKAAEPAAPAAAAPAPAGQTQEPAPALPEPKERGPIGSPSVNSPDLPARGTPELAGAEQAPKTRPAPKGGKNSVRPVDFTYNDAAAKEVYLLGPFLVRSGGRKPLVKGASGAWRLTVYLNSATTYQYHFEVVDSQGRKAATAKQSLDVP